ncbi:hypothetical protein DGMP_38490 [Desulfomarina profundi]|uniref:Transposase n=1 Tax=Desulfomarina profundi TaxID=2772557 RepID=A0A8D5JTG4_9BACT|nr:hypothetical protein [Desulfomarina profundi]BCL63156.1 hypothetical protein DGMP_38490 [Desulfomarina profundi]
MDNNSKKDFWHRHIEECEKSHLSQIEYCTTHNIALSTFGYWKRKLGKDQNRKPVFYPLTVSPSISHKNGIKESGLTLHVKDGRFTIQIEKGFSSSALSEVITTLEQL